MFSDVPTTPEPGGSGSRSPILPHGGLGGVSSGEGGNNQLGLVLGIVLGGLLLLLLLLSLGVYLCRHSNARNTSAEHGECTVLKAKFHLIFLSP